MSLIVQKFGGSSLSSPEKIKAVAKKVVQTYKKQNKVVVVVSAMGDTTDKLLEWVEKISPSPPPREVDMLLSTGEQISAAFMAIAINSFGVPAVSFNASQIGIITDAAFTHARIKKVKAEKIKKELDSGKVVIVTGFQGVTLQREITTLGRGGSDLTAVALAIALKADYCEIYTDVEGIYTADPRIVKEAKKIKRISFDEMLEIASLGAQVMQARSIEMAKKYNVKIYVKSSLKNTSGTTIG